MAIINKVNRPVKSIYEGTMSEYYSILYEFEEGWQNIIGRYDAESYCLLLNETEALPGPTLKPESRFKKVLTSLLEWIKNIKEKFKMWFETLRKNFKEKREDNKTNSKVLDYVKKEYGYDTRSETYKAIFGDESLEKVQRTLNNIIEDICTDVSKGVWLYFPCYEGKIYTSKLKQFFEDGFNADADEDTEIGDIYKKVFDVKDLNEFKKLVDPGFSMNNTDARKFLYENKVIDSGELFTELEESFSCILTSLDKLEQKIKSAKSEEDLKAIKLCKDLVTESNNIYRAEYAAVISAHKQATAYITLIASRTKNTYAQKFKTKEKLKKDLKGVKPMKPIDVEAKITDVED